MLDGRPEQTVSDSNLFDVYLQAKQLERLEQYRPWCKRRLQRKGVCKSDRQ